MDTFVEEINRYIAQRERVDLKAIHAQLSGLYPIVLTNTYALKNGAEDFGEDFEILCGESPVGKFYLYDNGLDIIFDVDKSDGTYIHWHPENTSEAAEDVKLFMQGICKG